MISHTFLYLKIGPETGLQLILNLGGPPGRCPPPNFTCKNFFESYICPCDNIYSSYLELSLLCVCVTVKIQFDNISTYEYSSY